MDNCYDLNSFQIKLEETELIIKDEPEEVAIENSSLDIIYDKSFPTPVINDQLLNTQVEVVPSICRIEDSNNIQTYQMKSFNSKFEMKVEEDYTIRETSIAEDTLKSKRNVGNYDFDALEVKLEHEEVIIKDEPEEVIENTSSLEIIQLDTIPVTLGIRDRIANTQIKVDPSICRTEDLLKICTCAVEVIMIPQHVFTAKMEQYRGSKLHNIGEANYDDEDCMVQEDSINCKMNVSKHDFDALEVKLEQDELIIKDEPEEVIENTSSLEIIQLDTFPVTLAVRDRIANTQIKVDPSIFRIEDLLKICTCAVEVSMIPQHVFTTKMEQYRGSKLHNIGEANYDDEDCMVQEDSINCKMNDFDALEVKLEHEELIIKDEPEQVIENTSSLEIIQFDTIPVTLGIKDRIANTQIKVDPSIFRIGDLFKICTCTVEVSMIPQHVFTTKMEQYLVSKLQNIAETNYDEEDCMAQEDAIKCKICTQQVPQTLFRRHMLHHKITKHKDGDRENEDLKVHKHSHKSKKSFKHNGKFKKHMLLHDDKKSFKCQHCNKFYTDNGTLKKHMLIHKGLKPFKCHQCNKCFTASSSLKSHMLIHKGLKPFKCHQCNKCFTASSSLKNHMLIHKGLKPFKCQQCNKCFTQNINLKSHMLIHKGLKLFKCQQCNKCFTVNSNLKRHMLIHKVLKPFKCQQCNKCFTQNSNLKIHMLIHEGLKRFKCLQCNKCFTANSSLKNHMLIHKELKPFKCQQCNKCFTVNSNLKRHMLIHKVRKPFKCQQCNKCFTVNSNLKRHMLIHEGLKRFKCLQCNKCFTANSSLKNHMLIHKGLKPFKCQQCNKCFTVNSNLKRHMLIHKGLKPFKCLQYDKCYTRSSHLKRHSC